MKITFLSDNITEDARCLAEWGLSLYIESGGRKILFDLGSSSIFAENADKLGIDLAAVDFAAISHGHYDHTGGAEAFLERNGKAPIYLHRNALAESYGLDEDGKMDEESCGIRWSEELRERIKGRLIFTGAKTAIDENVSLLGEISPLPEFPMTETFYIPVNAEKTEFRPDSMDHEQVLVIREGDGLHVFSGCAHTGIMAILKRVAAEYPGEQIVSVTAGMHLYALPREKKEQIADAFASMGIRHVLPVHCTGMEAIMIFREKMGEACVIASAGKTYEF